MGRQSQRKTERQEADHATPPRHHPPAQGGQGLAITTLVAVMGVLMISFANWRDITRIEGSLDTPLVVRLTDEVAGTRRP